MTTRILPASEDQVLQKLLAEAAEKASRYEWIPAAEFYEKALDALGPKRDPVETARITELLAKSYFKAAFQSETREEFKKTIGLAKVEYQRLSIFYEEAGSEALSKLSKGRVLFAEYWLTEEPSDRKRLTEEATSLAEEAAGIFEGQENNRGLADAHKEVLTYLTEAYRFAPDWRTLRVLYEKAMRSSEKAIHEFEALGEDEALLECLNGTSWFVDDVAFFVLKPSESSEVEKTREQLGHKVRKLVESGATPYASFLANEALAYLEIDRAKGLEFSDKALSAAQVTRDKLATGRVLAVAGQNAMWAQMLEEDVEKRRELFERELEFAGKAIALLEVPFSGHLLDWAYDDYATAYTGLATYVDTEIEQKKEHLKEAISWSKKGMAYKDHQTWPAGPHSMSKAMYFLATLLSDPAEKKKLLRDALPLREEALRQDGIVMPYSWDTGVMLNYLALTKAELSKVEEDPVTKAELLKSAVVEMEKCVELCGSWAIHPDYMRAAAMYHDWYGDILNQLYLLTGGVQPAERSINAYQESIAYLTKSKFLGPIAQLRWKVASVYNTLGDYQAAATSFTKAAEDYILGAEKIPSLAPLFKELSTYMAAWALIEESRVYHDEEQYSLAAENYGKAATTLQSAKPWSHLSKHYLACALLETGEALSRQEKPEASIQSFSSAAQTFREAKTDLDGILNENTRPSEREELEDWVRVTNVRAQYCLGRLELEEAKVFDRKGERSTSAK